MYVYITYVCIHNIYLVYIWYIYIYIYGGMHGIHHVKIEGIFEAAIKGYPKWNCTHYH